MEQNDTVALGKEGTAPTVTASVKDGIVTALGTSRLWATIGHGILNEVFWQATGQPQVRDLGFIVAGDNYWAEVKRISKYTLTTPAPYIPLPQVVHTGERYALTLAFLPDPARDVLLIRPKLDGARLRLYPLLAPPLALTGRVHQSCLSHGLFAAP